MKFWLKPFRWTAPLKWASEVNVRLDLLETRANAAQRATTSEFSSLASRLESVSQRLNGTERADASTRGDLTGLTNRIARLEQLIGILEADQSDTTSTALSEILAVRLT